MSQRKIKKLRNKEKTDEILTQGAEVVKHSIRNILSKNKVFLLLISIGILCLFFNGIRGDFVSDDYATIINNSEIGSLNYFDGNITPVMLANFLVGNIFGIHPIPYHIFSVLFYIFTCWTAFIFLNFVTSERIAKIALGLFAGMSIHVEAVTWISGKPYLFIAFFVMFSTITFIKYLEEDKPRFLVYSAISFLLALLADIPRPFSIFLVIFLYLVMTNNRQYWQKSKKTIPYIGLLLITSFLIKLPTITNRVQLVNGGYNATDSIFYNPFFQYPTGIPKYLQLILFPVDLTLYHTMYILPVWLNWMIFLSYIGLLIVTFKRNKNIFFGLSFFLLTLLPSMAPIKVSWLVAERYGLLPSLGIAMVMATVIDDLWKRRKEAAIVVMSGWCVFYAVRTYLRNIDWQTNHNLWVNTCQVSPNSHNAWNNIGDDYDKLAAEATNDTEKMNQYYNAIKGFSQSTIVKPNYADAYHNRANILYKIGRLDLARDSYETALYYTPTLYQTYLSLVQIDLLEGKIQLAMEHANKAVEIQPNDPQSAYVVAVVYAQGGEFEKAEQILKNILQAYPNYTQASETLKQLKAIMIGNS